MVLTSSKLGKILDCLEGKAAGVEEDSRKIYVGASGAERLLALAVPKNSTARVEKLLAASGCATRVHDI